MQAKASNNVKVEDDSVQVELINNNSYTLDDTLNKHVWAYDEVRCLLDSYKNHQNEFNSPRTKKYVWDNIANDLVAAGYNANAKICLNKWKNMLRSYRATRESRNRNFKQGANLTTRFQFYKDMDEIVRNSPQYKIESLDDKIDDAIMELQTDDGEAYNDDDTLETTSNGKRMRFSDLEIKKERHDEKMALQREQMQIEERKLNLLEQRLDNSNHSRRLRNELRDFREQKRKRHEDKMEIAKEKLRLEQRKIQLLEIYLRSKNIEVPEEDPIE